MPAKLRLEVVAVITTSWCTEGACTPAKLRVKGLALTTTSLGHGGVFSLGFSPTLMPERGSSIEPVGSLSRPAFCLYSCPFPICVISGSIEVFLLFVLFQSVDRLETERAWESTAKKHGKILTRGFSIPTQDDSL